jgi:site-specific recombinase XerD
VRLKQRNWPAKTVKRNTGLVCGRMVAMLQDVIQRGACQDWTHLTPDLIEAYIDAKLCYGWAVGTINGDVIQFRTFCRFARDEGYPVPDPMTQLKTLDTPRRLPRPLSDEAVRRLEQCIQDAIIHAKSDAQRRAIRDRACFYLMWHCGLRISEGCDLLVTDLDLAGQQLFVRDRKERKDRRLYVSQTTVQALQQHLEVRQEQAAPYVFPSRPGGLTPRSLRRRIRHYGQQCGVPVTAHQLRHTFASQMLAAGMSITSLQRYLGHENLNTTMIYAEVSDPMLQRDYYRGAATFDPASGDLARRVLDLSEREELQQLVAQLKYPDLEASQRREILEQIERLLAESGSG